MLDYNDTDDGLICEKDVKILPENQRCVFDEDAAGFITGCRSRSHLENCGVYSFYFRRRSESNNKMTINILRLKLRLKDFILCFWVVY